MIYIFVDLSMILSWIRITYFYLFGTRMNCKYEANIDGILIAVRKAAYDSYVI